MGARPRPAAHIHAHTPSPLNTSIASYSPAQLFLQRLILSVSLAPQALAQAALKRGQLAPPLRQLVSCLAQAVLALTVQALQAVQLALAAAHLVTQLVQAPCGQRQVCLTLLQGG